MHFPIRPIDLLNEAPLLRGDLQVFNPIRTNWQTWVKPKGVTMCFMLAIGGGGGGGGGFSTVTNTSLGGGGGGAAGGVSKLLIPAFFLPDNLFIQVGEGGTAGQKGANSGSATTAGGQGGISYISLGRSTANPNVLFQSSATAPGGGGGGASAAAGSAGTVPTAAVATNALLQLGIFASNISNIAGGTGGLGAGGSITAYADGQIFTTAGGGGGNASAGAPGTANVGGSIVATGDYEFITAGGHLVPPAATAQITAFTLIQGGRLPPDGNYTGGAGMNIYSPFIFTGGGGGQSTIDQVTAAGEGGRGGIGGGGGGGGSGHSPTGQVSRGANGGPGGPGLVVIYSW